MSIQKTFVNNTMRIKHPSGVIATHTIKDLEDLKELTNQSIVFLQQQIALIDADISLVKSAKE